MKGYPLQLGSYFLKTTTKGMKTGALNAKVRCKYILISAL